MILVNADIFGSSIEIGKIYYFESDQLRNTTEPHNFVVIAIAPDDVIIFSCITSQFEKRNKFITLSGIPETTLVWLKPNGDNGLTKDSYVDCNSCFKYAKSDIIDKYRNGELKYKGCVKDSKISEIHNGIIESPMIVEEIKQIIKSIQF